MNNSRIFDLRLLVTLLVSVGFGLMFLKLLPLFSAKPIFLMALPLTALAFIALITKPKLVFTLLILSRPLLDNLLNLTKTSTGGQGVGIGAALNLGIVVLAVFLYFYRGDFAREDKVVRAWLVFLFLMFLAALYSSYRLPAIRLYFNYLTYFAIFIIPFQLIKTKEDFLYWLKILAWSFVLPVFCANLDLLRGGDFYVDAGNRIKGTFTHPNVLGFYLILGISVYFYIFTSNYFKLKNGIAWCMKILMLNMFILLVATKSRNAWIACAGVFLIYGILKDRKLLVSFLLVMPLTFAIPQIRERIATVSEDNSKQEYRGMNSLEWRLRMWENSLPKIKERPLQGHGLASFLPMSEQFHDLKYIGKNAAHNAYLEMLFESGIVGLCSYVSLFLIPLMIFFKRMRSSIDTIQGKLCAIGVAYLICYMLICSADNLLHYLVFNWYVWFFISLMLVAQRISNSAATTSRI